MGGIPKIRIGVCSMDKKARSKPMVAIMERLTAFGEFEIVTFGDDTITDKPWEEWPLCDCLLSWFSDGFPLKKVSIVCCCCGCCLCLQRTTSDVLMTPVYCHQFLTTAMIV